MWQIWFWRFVYFVPVFYHGEGSFEEMIFNLLAGAWAAI